MSRTMDAFIAYGGPDRHLAAALVDELRRRGLRVRWDRDLAQPPSWLQQLPRWLVSARRVIVLLSDRVVDASSGAITRRYLADEVQALLTRPGGPALSWVQAGQHRPLYPYACGSVIREQATDRLADWAERVADRLQVELEPLALVPDVAPMQDGFGGLARLAQRRLRLPSDCRAVARSMDAMVAFVHTLLDRGDVRRLIPYLPQLTPWLYVFEHYDTRLRLGREILADLEHVATPSLDQQVACLHVRSEVIPLGVPGRWTAEQREEIAGELAHPELGERLLALEARLERASPLLRQARIARASWCRVQASLQPDPRRRLGILREGLEVARRAHHEGIQLALCRLRAASLHELGDLASERHERAIAYRIAMNQRDYRRLTLHEMEAARAAHRRGWSERALEHMGEAGRWFGRLQGGAHKPWFQADLAQKLWTLERGIRESSAEARRLWLRGAVGTEEA